MADRLSVIVTRRLPEPVETRLRELFDVKLNETDAPMSAEALGEAVKQADVLVPTVTDRIDQRLLALAGDRLKLIANYGAGFDHIDVETARSRGMIVTNTPGVLTEDTADMTMALMLAVPRRLMEGGPMQGGPMSTLPTAFLFLSLSFSLSLSLWGLSLSLSLSLGPLSPSLSPGALSLSL